MFGSLLSSHGPDILDSVVTPEVGDDEPLTQYGHEGDDPPFRNATRSYETDVSLIRGQLSTRDAASLIRRQGERYEVTERDRVRHTTVPSRRIPGHVSVELQNPEDVWDNSARNRFGDCFEE